MTYQEIESKIFDFFSNQDRLLKVVGSLDDIHYNYLLKQIEKKIQNTENIKLYTKGFPMPSDIKAIQMVQYSLSTMNLNHLNQEDITLTNNPAINKNVKDAILTILQPRLLEPFKSNNVKFNFFTKQIVWLYEMLTQHFDMSKPKLLVYYGTASEDDLLQLKMLYMIGFKILYINSFQDENLGVGDTLKLDSIAPMKDFKLRVSEAVNSLPENNITNSENSSNKITTWAGEAKEELYNTLYDQNSIIRPWQFKTWTTDSVNFNAVLEDIKTYWAEDAKLRPNFKAENGKVLVPNFMTKINGCYQDLGEYFSFIANLRHTELCMFLVGTTFLQRSYNTQEMYSLGFVFDGKFINEEKLKNHALYRLHRVNSNVTTFMIKKLNEFIKKYENDLELKDFVELIATVITLQEELLRMIENFDFSFKIPKFIFYIYDRSNFDKRTANFINYINLIGFDVLFLSPTGADSMEEYMYGDTLNTILLDEMKFDLTYEELVKYQPETKKKGFFSSFFGG